MEAFNVYHDFLDLPDLIEVREDALRNGFGTWSPACDSVLKVNKFAGVGYMGRHDILLKTLALRFGKMPFPREMKFRTTGDDAEPAYIHSDRPAREDRRFPAYTCIVYLSPGAPQESGTAFYRYAPNPAHDHLKNGLPFMPCYQDQAGTLWGAELQRDMRGENPEDTKKWLLTGFVHGMMNTAVVFPSQLFHSRLPRLGFGETDQTARLIWVAHFVL